MKRYLDDSRRRFIVRCGSLATMGLLAVTGCGKKNDPKAEDDPAGESSVSSCDDLKGVSENDLALRKKLGYVEKSPIADNQCLNCNLFLPPKEGQNCGGCMLFKGPVFTDAYCTYWAPKV
jgi:hypothetical protein